MKEITDKLSSIGAPISEEDQVVTLLGSLPQSYSTFVTTLEARADDNLKLAHVQQALIHKELKITEKFVQAANTLPGEQTTSPWLAHKETTSHGNQGAICAVNLVIFNATALTKGNTTILELHHQHPQHLLCDHHQG